MGHRLLATIGSAVLGEAAPAHAEVDSVEIGGFIGVEDFSSRAELGDPKTSEQRPQTSPMVGIRLGYVDRTLRYLDIGPEAELSFAPAWTGYGFDSGRESHFVPVIGYRAGLLLRLRLPVLQPHGTIGVGGQTLIANSPFISTDTDSVLHYGVGATVEVMPRWQVRVDGRRSMVPSDGGATTSNYELLIGVVARLGGSAAPRVAVARPAEPPPPPKPVAHATVESTCSAHTGDRYPGCSASDPDGDRIVGDADRCPSRAEDFDRFQDGDGCPELDNDNDGIADLTDPCPDRAETANGFEDADGCPDEIPGFMTVALAGARNVRFEPGRARLTAAARRQLDQVIVALRSPATIHIVVTAHPDSARPGVAEKRADVVKWYLVEHGIPVDELHTKVSTLVKPDGPPIEIAIAPK